MWNNERRKQARELLRQAEELKRKAESGASEDEIKNALLETSKSVDAFEKLLNTPVTAEDLFLSPEDLHGEIAEYTLLAAELHERRLGAVRTLELRFDAARRDEVQPFLSIGFDGERISVELGELWDSPLELGKRGKECGIMAENIWFDYVEAAPTEDIPVMAEAVRRAAVERYPQAEVKVSIDA